MPYDPLRHVHLADGRFASNDGAGDLDKLFVELRRQFSSPGNKKRLVIHFHGGLVSRDAGIAIGDRLQPRYAQDAGACSAFFVWESGLFETLQNNLPAIAKEAIFRYVLERALSWAGGKLDTAARSATLTPMPITPAAFAEDRAGDYFAELAAWAAQRQLADVEPITAADESRVSTVLEQDPTLVALVQAIVPAPLTRGGVPAQKPTPTLMDASVLAELRVGQNKPDARGLVSAAKVAFKVAKIVRRVVRRFRNDRDHGLYLTVVEEVLREFYVSAAGWIIWHEMKQDTAGSFGDDPSCGGSAFLLRLDKLIETVPDIQVCLVGHSTGAIYIRHFIAAAERTLTKSTKFDVALLAPAATFALIAGMFEDYGPRIGRVTLFGMGDAVEKSDPLMGGLVDQPVIDRILRSLYPASLLYFVSGVLEDEVDMPLIGMQRYYAGVAYSKLEAVGMLRDHMAARLIVPIWTRSNTPPLRVCHAIHHGDFDSDELPLASLMAFIRN